MREVQKTLVLAGVETEGSAHHQRLVSLVESHRAVMVIFMQVRRPATFVSASSFSLASALPKQL